MFMDAFLSPPCLMYDRRFFEQLLYGFCDTTSHGLGLEDRGGYFKIFYLIPSIRKSERFPWKTNIASLAYRLRTLRQYLTYVAWRIQVTLERFPT